jgi:hypothetical protein
VVTTNKSFFFHKEIYPKYDNNEHTIIMNNNWYNDKYFTQNKKKKNIYNDKQATTPILSKIGCNYFFSAWNEALDKLSHIFFTCIKLI